MGMTNIVKRGLAHKQKSSGVEHPKQYNRGKTEGDVQRIVKKTLEPSGTRWQQVQVIRARWRAFIEGRWRAFIEARCSSEE